MRHLRPVRSFLVAQLLVIFLVCALQHVNAQINNVGQKAGGVVNPATPCCAITNIDASGLVTAQDKTTGKSFQFQVNDSSLLSSLHIGQAVSADYATSQVSVGLGGPCCNITGTGATSTGGTSNLAGTTGAGMPGMPGVMRSQEMEDMPGVFADLIQVTREGDVLTIKVRFRNTSDKQVYLNLTRGGRCDGYYVTAGTKRYTVLKDGPSVWQMAVKSYCNETAPGIAPGQTFTFWGKFQAPPATVKKIDFFTPIMPPFEGIPITDTSTGAIPANPGTSILTPAKAPNFPPKACCTITQIDVESGVTTAVMSTPVVMNGAESVQSTMFQFKVPVLSQKLMFSVQVGQYIFANFDTRQVSLDGRVPCCEIITVPPPTTSASQSLPPNYASPGVCAPGYYGANCMACPGSPNVCSNHGTCSEGTAGTGACTCYSGYSGSYCQNGP